MKKHTEAGLVIEEATDGKRIFTRQRTRVLKVVPEIVHGVQRFKVTTYHAGKRVRRFFATEREAKTFVAAETVRAGNIGSLAKHVDARLATDAAECQTLLKPHGARLLDVCREWSAARTTLKDFPDVTLAECVAHYSQVLSERQTSWTLDEAAEEWQKHLEQEKASTRYLGDVRSRLSRIREQCGPMSMADITQEHLREWLDSLGALSPQTRLNYRTVARSLFSFAIGRKKAPRNPFDEIKRPSVTRDEAGIFTPDELTRLMHHLPADAHAFVALGAFAGLRPAEILRLEWKDVNFKSGTIVVGIAKAKTKRRRTVPISDNLRAWLIPLAKKSGKVVELGEHVLRKERIAPAMEAAGLTQWPHDVLRHSAATYMLAREKNSALVALMLGNTPDVLHEHYLSLAADPEHAAQWFQITPAKHEGAQIIPFKAA